MIQTNAVTLLQVAHSALVLLLSCSTYSQTMISMTLLEEQKAGMNKPYTLLQL